MATPRQNMVRDLKSMRENLWVLPALERVKREYHKGNLDEYEFARLTKWIDQSWAVHRPAPIYKAPVRFDPQPISNLRGAPRINHFHRFKKTV